MNVKKAYNNFRVLKEEIEKDGKIDTFEIEVLLKFLEPYCKKNDYSSKNKFNVLKNLLLRAKGNGGVQEEESAKMIETIYEVLKNLRRAYKIERTLNYTFAFLTLAGLFYYVFYC